MPPMRQQALRKPPFRWRCATAASTRTPPNAVLFITTVNEVARIPPALRGRLEIIDLPGYTEVDKIAIAETYLIPVQNRAAGLTAAPVRFTRGACGRMIRDDPGMSIRQLAARYGAETDDLCLSVLNLSI